MRDITTAMKGYLATSNPTLATLWTVTAADGLVIRSTDFSTNITYNGETYSAAYGQIRTAIQFTVDLQDENLSSSGFLSLYYDRSEIAAGRFNFAKVEIVQVNPFDLTMGDIKMLKGTMGAIQVEDNIFRTEISSRLAELSSAKVSLTSPTCRARLGDNECRVNLASVTTTGTVTAVDSNNYKVSVTLANPALSLKGGVLTWTGGENTGGQIDVKSYAAGIVGFYLWPVYTPEVGDTFTAVQGCDKLFSTCKNTYNNAVNFRGEPDVPGSLKYFELAGRDI